MEPTRADIDAHLATARRLAQQAEEPSIASPTLLHAAQVHATIAAAMANYLMMLSLEAIQLERK